jgi:hypothetical protein
VELADWESRGYEFLDEFRRRYMAMFGRDYFRECRKLLAIGVIALLDGLKFLRRGSPASPAKK